MEWDTAAGHAVVEAAGGTVEQPNGDSLAYNKQNLLNPYFIVSGRRK
jgi:3'(2'), 5'-bisphosphate nucleotidase